MKTNREKATELFHATKEILETVVTAAMGLPEHAKDDQFVGAVESLHQYAGFPNFLSLL